MILFLKCKRQILLLAFWAVIFSGGAFGKALHAQEKDANHTPVAEVVLTAAAENQTADDIVANAKKERPGAGANPQPPANEYGTNARNNRPRFNARQQRLEEELRRAMSNLGCVEADVQDTVLEYIREETKARRPLLEQSRRLFFILRTSSQNAEPKNPSPVVEPLSPLGETIEEGVFERPGNYTVRSVPTKEQLEDDATLASQIAAYRVAVEADRTRHKAAEAALDGKIKFSQNPRLEAMLLLMGIIGDSPNLPLRAGAFGAVPPRPPAPRNVPPATAPPATAPVDPNVIRNAK